MTEKTVDVVGIGNAIVDIIAHCDDDFIEEWSLIKGAMTLIDQPRAVELYDAMGPAIEVSGGSAANTIAGIASLGGKAAASSATISAPPASSSKPRTQRPAPAPRAAWSSSPPMPSAR